MTHNDLVKKESEELLRFISSMLLLDLHLFNRQTQNVKH